MEIVWGASGTTLCVPTFHHGVLEGKGKVQGIENLFEELITEKFPNLAKEIDIQVQEAQSPKQDEPKEDHTKTFHN